MDCHILKLFHAENKQKSCSQLWKPSQASDTWLVILIAWHHIQCNPPPHQPLKPTYVHWTDLLAVNLTPIPASRSKKAWCKTIVLVSLTRKEGVRASKRNAWVDYEVVNLIESICLHCFSCDRPREETSRIWCASTRLQVLSTPWKWNTSGEEFWKSTQKVLATSRELYKKFTGQTTDGKHWADAWWQQWQLWCVISFKQKINLGLQVSRRYSPQTKRNCQGCASVQKLVTFMSNMKNVLCARA